jgi:hypothetical protein
MVEPEYKIRAYNDEKSFFLRNEYEDIIYTSKNEAENFRASILGIYQVLLGYKDLEVLKTN